MLNLNCQEINYDVSLWVVCSNMSVLCLEPMSTALMWQNKERNNQIVKV